MLVQSFLARFAAFALASFVLPVVLVAQDGTSIPNRPPDAPTQPRNVARIHSGDQVLQFKSGPIPLHMPSRISECEAGQCTVWQFNGATGSAHWRSGAVAVLTVERFDYDGVVIHRRDVSGSTPGLTAIYTGKIVDQQIKGDVTWTWPGHFNGGSPHSVWAGTVLVPSDYQVLDLTLPCAHYTGLSGEEASLRGGWAIKSNDNRDGICWLTIAATLGDPDANGILASDYYLGREGVAVNKPKAIPYAQKGAEGDSYLADAVLYRMYTDGTLGKDPDKAKYWKAKSETDQAATELKEKQDQEADVQFQKDAMKIQNINEAAMEQALQRRQQSGVPDVSGILSAIIFSAMALPSSSQSSEPQEHCFKTSATQARCEMVSH